MTNNDLYVKSMKFREFSHSSASFVYFTVFMKTYFSPEDSVVPTAKAMCLVSYLLPQWALLTANNERQICHVWAHLVRMHA